MVPAQRRSGNRYNDIVGDVSMIDGYQTTYPHVTVLALHRKKSPTPEAKDNALVGRSCFSLTFFGRLSNLAEFNGPLLHGPSARRGFYMSTWKPGISIPRDESKQDDGYEASYQIDACTRSGG